MSAPVLIRPNLKAEVIQCRGTITGKPYFALGVMDPDTMKYSVYLQAPCCLYDFIEHPENFFKELAYRINKGGEQ